MTDKDRSKDDLLRELEQLRNRVTELEAGSDGSVDGTMSPKVLEQLAQGSPVGIFITQDTRLVYTNPMMSDLTGYSSEELHGMEPGDLVHPDEREQVRQNGLAGAAGEDVAQRSAIHALRKSGESIRIDCFTEPILVDGRPAVMGTAIDITDRVLAEDRLAESENKYRALVEDSDDAIFSVDKWGTFIFMNEAAAAHLGGKPQDLIGKTQWDVFPKDVADRQMTSILRVIETGEGFSIEAPSVIHKGRVFHTKGQPLRNKDGKVVAATCLSHDHSDLFDARDALSESEERYRQLVDRLPVGILQASPEGKVISANPALVRMFGCDSIEEYLALPDRDSFRDPSERDKIVGIALEKGEIRDYEVQVRRKDGSYFWVSFSGHVAFDKNGKLARFDGIEVDITERRLATNALRRSGETMSALLNAPTQALFLMDTRGILLTLNEALAETLGRPVEELVGTCVHDYIPESLVEFRKAKELEVIESGKPTKYVDEHGGNWREIRLYPVFDDHGRVEALAVYSLDITKHKEAENALKASEERYRGLFENSQVGMFRSSIDGKTIQAVNQKMADIWGGSIEEALEKGSLEAWASPEDRDRFIQLLQQDGVVTDYEGRMMSTQGTPLYGLISARLMPEEGVIEGSVVDITDRKLAEEALRDSEGRFRGILSSLHETMIVMCDRDGNYLEAWMAVDLEKRYGMTGQSLVGKSVHDFLPSEMLPHVLGTFQRMFDDGESVRKEYLMPLPTGEFWHDISISPVRGDSGEVTALVGFIRDITERKKAEDDLRSSQANLLSILENTSDLIMLADRDSKIVYMNSAFVEAVRDLISVDIEPGMNLNEKMPADEGKKWQELYDRALSGERFLFEFSWIAVDGVTRHFETWFSPIRSDDEVHGFSQFTHEVTERKEAETAIRESEDKFRRIAERSFDPIFVTDIGGNLTFASPAAEAVMGYDPEEMVGHNVSEFVHSSSLPEIARGFAKNAQGRSVEGIPVKMIRADGETVHTEVNATAVFKGGRVVGSQAIVRDMSLRRRAEEMLQQSYDEQSRQLRQVAGGLAHDVYNDLFPVAAAIHKLRQRLLDSAQPVGERDRGLLLIMDKAIRRAIDLTESVDLYSKLDRNEADVGTNLASAVDEVADQNRDQLSEKGILLEIKVPDSLDVNCPRIQVFHLTNNLLLNAIEALQDSKTRLIRISAALEGQLIKVRFEDSGCGISAAVLSRIFEPFYSTRPKTGTGLGLAIVRRIVDVAGGEIEVQSVLDKGTIFTITLSGNVGTRK